MKNLLTPLVAFLLLLSACQTTDTSSETSTETIVASSDKPIVISQKLPPQAFAQLLQEKSNAILIDVRMPVEYESGSIEGAENINLLQPKFEEMITAQAQPDQPVFLYCKVGGRSGRAARALENLGYTEIYDLEGGYKAWTKATVER